MTNHKDDVDELEVLLNELEAQDPQLFTPYSEDDDAVTQMMDAPIDDEERRTQVAALHGQGSAIDRPPLAAAAAPLPQALASLPTTGAESPAEASRAPAAPLGDITPRAPVVAVPLPRLTPTPAAPAWSITAGRPLVPPPTAVPVMAAPQPPAALPPTALAFTASPPAALPFASPPPEAMAPAVALEPAAPSGARELPHFMPAPLPQASPAPSPRSQSTRPVAVDFSPTAPTRDRPFQLVAASGAIAFAMIILTSYALSAGGVFTAGAEIKTRIQEVNSLQLSEQVARQPTPSAVEQPTEAKASEAEPAETRPTETKPTETKPAETKPTETKPTETKPTETKPTETNAEVSMRPEAVGDGAANPVAPATASAPQRSTPPPERASRRNTTARAENAARRRGERSIDRRLAGGAAPVEVTREEEQVKASAREPITREPGNTFNVEAANAALDGAAQQAKNCRPSGGPTGNGRVEVRYQPSGKVASVSILTPEFANSAAESCITMLFRRASVPAFAGVPVVVMDKSFEIP